MRRLEELFTFLASLEGRPYPFYKDLKGTWRGEGFDLRFVHVQGDPFATPSVVEVRYPARALEKLRVYRHPTGKVAVEDFLLRALKARFRHLPFYGGSGHSGRVFVEVESPKVLRRAGAHLGQEALYLRFRVGLPASGRRILGKEAERLFRALGEHLRGFLWELDGRALVSQVQQVEDFAYIQESLPQRGLVAFVGDGAILPRESGVSQKPLRGAVPFQSPPSLRVSFRVPHKGEVVGMGLPQGVTLITGGGFHGKTTLLEALIHGVYPHIPGDGREWVVAHALAQRVQSEDGRSVKGVDLRPFVHDLPLGQDTSFFSTEDASGSTSLAAAILEALELGARVLLLDEDTSATNLLVRDARMQALVQRETLTPLLDRVQDFKARGISLILVVGGVGDYLDLADTVLLLEEYRPREATLEARAIAQAHPTGRTFGEPRYPLAVASRAPLPESFDPRRGRKARVKGRGLRELVYGEEVVDLSALDLFENAQVRALGAWFQRLWRQADGKTPLRKLVEAVPGGIEDLFSLEEAPEVAEVRPLELGAAVNRLRSLEVRRGEG
ncbi:ABC-ATPase domain-containing protein [Thermus scotoductus]|uniref:Isopentenyl-diphosphate delta-isomerase n=1 Tax=Thermus scotoductus TaxID=37636 RepID=A0A430R7L6_THESC|nr:ABC-ATPase domain-containing protein [Thermus scotoductus]RTG98095.1 isopentenyl-diphosphate delta-isomerase [Thermus scotoductus]RTH03416.1 isopentenyl-diphosphate delta-isomerase [Thermus scotoductus]RTH22367.1 isopentenyl-diphosphate delta-isomerase [Thermus scotoductus]RTH96820.1 isopentenyl-diphosphate delta-isomerase [Thermus scotoductus]RTI24649.1 isopentenyl-diphosphate delta-isomerase [Thermus scotoductus]